MSVRHPAKFNDLLLDQIASLLDAHDFEGRILDPFAGTGRVHELRHPTVGVEIEPEWAELHPDTLVGSALHLPFAGDSFDGIVTSPCYGNRMADHHEARDSSRRNTYRHAIGRPLHPESAGALQWGPAYQEMHAAAWKEVRRVAKRGALFVLNISDHIRRGKRQPVTTWHLRTLTEQGWERIDARRIQTPRNRYGANGNVRVSGEWLLVLRLGAERR